MPKFTVHANASDARSFPVHRTIRAGFFSVICVLTLLPVGSLRAAAASSLPMPASRTRFWPRTPIPQTFPFPDGSSWARLAESRWGCGILPQRTTWEGRPDGSNLFWCGENTGAVPQSLDLRGVSQVLADNLMQNTTYVLTVQIGNPPAYHDPLRTDDGFPGYQVELLAGGVVVALDRNSLLPANGAFVTSTVAFTSGNTHPQMGQPLEIRLLNQRQQVAGLRP